MSGYLDNLVTSLFASAPALRPRPVSRFEQAPGADFEWASAPPVAPVQAAPFRAASHETENTASAPSTGQGRPEASATRAGTVSPPEGGRSTRRDATPARQATPDTRAPAEAAPLHPARTPAQPVRNAAGISSEDRGIERPEEVGFGIEATAARLTDSTPAPAPSGREAVPAEEETQPAAAFMPSHRMPDGDDGGFTAGQSEPSPARAVFHTSGFAPLRPAPDGAPGRPAPSPETATAFPRRAGELPFPVEAASFAAPSFESPAAQPVRERRAVPPPPAVEVTIGRIEVRAERPADPPAPPPAAPTRPATPSLDDYLARRRAEK